jgi:hypothetical protein
MQGEDRDKLWLGIILLVIALCIIVFMFSDVAKEVGQFIHYATGGNVTKIEQTHDVATDFNISSAVTTALATYVIDKGHYPETLDVLVEQRYIGPNVLQDTRGQKLKTIKVGNTYRIISPGADGRFGNEDDIMKVLQL